MRGCKMCFALFFFYSLANGQVSTDAHWAFDQSKKENKAIFLIFSGSDWCKPCIRFDQQVTQDSLFQAFAQEKLILLKADFPQRIKQSEALRQQNEWLAERYNPQGYFPHLVLLGADSALLATFMFQNQDSPSFIKIVQQKLMEFAGPTLFKQQARLMGSAFELRVSAQDKITGKSLLDSGIAEIQRIESILTEFDEQSITSQINLVAGISSLKVNEEVFQLIQRCLQLAELSQGAFDITATPLRDLYNFKGQDFMFPDSAMVRKALKQVGYQKVFLEKDSHVFLSKKDMKISFGAIGKGYAADRVKALWEAQGVENGLINASGDLTAWGTSPDGSPWKVGIANPDSPNEILFWLPIENASIATSGDYEQFFDYKGKRYSHTIDPKTGYPVSHTKSVSVIAPSAELADALATAVFVMGTQPGLHLIDQLPDVHCILIDADNTVHTSALLDLNLLK